MLKKFFTGLMAAGMLLATSCQQQEFTPALGEAMVTFEVATPEISTRAYSDGMTANKLQYAVYHNGVKSNLQCDPVEVKNGTASFSQSLTAGETYTIILWADYDDKNDQTVAPYAVTFANKIADAKMEVNYTGVKSNDEKLDAFYAVKVIEVKGTQTETVELKRPFAQLNIGTNDYAKAEAASGYVPTQSSVTVKGIYNTLNLADGTVSGDVDVIFGAAAIPDSKIETFPVSGYEYVAMNYVLVGAEQVGLQEKCVVDVAFTLTDGTNDKTRTVSSVPVQRNYRTNIYGSILTSDVDVNVEINPDYTTPDNVADALYLAAGLGGEFTLTEDITLEKPLNVTANLTIDLNGKTITGDWSKADGAVINVAKDVTLNLIGGKVKSVRENGGAAVLNDGILFLTNMEIEGAPSNTATGTASYAVNTQGVGSKLIANNVTISGRGAIGATKGAKIEINGGTYHTPAVAWGHAIYADGEGTEVVVNGGTFSEGYDFNATNWGMYQIYSGNKAKVIVNGGDFSQPWDCANGYDLCTATEGEIVIYGGTFAEDPSKQNGKNFLAPGHYALEYEAGKYTVHAIDAANRTLTINNIEELLKLNILNEKWNDFFSNGQGTDITNFFVENGGKGADYYYKWEWTIKLNADIDFEGATLNAPINMAGFGRFDGQNHTIKNVTIENDTKAGLFSSSGYGALKNIKLDKVHAIGGYNGNSTVGILASDCSAGVDNITITNSTAVGGKYTGGVVGYGYTYVTNCTLTNCVVKGGYKCGGVIGYICASNANGHNVTGNTLTNCTVVAAPQHADGKTEYVLGMVVGNYNCNGTCANNVVYDMTTTATKIIGKIEAGKVVNESNNVVTYVVENYDELKAAVINGGNIEFANDITVDEWIMFSEDLNISNGTIITIDEINVTIDGKGHTLTVNAIESAGNNDQLFQGASNLNISNLTIKYADGLTTGGLGMVSGVIKDVHFVGGGAAASSAAIFPGNGVIKVEDCIFDTNGVAIYFDDDRDNLTVTGCTFNMKDTKNVILLRGDVKFSGNTVNSGRTVNVVNGSPVVTGNDFKYVRFKVYGAATATISENIINNLEFDGTTYASTFTNNTLSAAAQAVLDAATKVN